MKKAIIILIGIVTATVALAQEPDTVQQSNQIDPVVRVDSTAMESPAVEIQETKSIPEPAEPLITNSQEQEVESESSQPKIIYYQSSPSESNETSIQRRQGRSEIKTLAGSMNHSGGFGALTFRTTDFKNEAMVLAGVRAGWIINRTVGIGFEGHGIIPTTKYTNVDPSVDVYAVGGYGGMFMELIVLSNTVVHVTFPASAGAGWLGYNTDWDADFDPGVNEYYGLVDEDVFWYVEPGANIELNISRNFRLDFGVSKRFTQDLKLQATRAQDFENLNYYFTLKIGGF
ncbi:MAG: hypothetical protein JXQ90_03295 [Cyclobacteriaceae bacterium]